MNNIEITEAVSTAIAQTTCERLSAKVGLSADVVHDVVGRGAVAVVAAMLARCKEPGAVETVFSEVMAPAANARIGEQFDTLIASTVSLKDLESAGDSLCERTTRHRIGLLSDLVSMQTGVPPQATHVLTGLSSAVLFGLLKRHLLLDQAAPRELALLLNHQLQIIAPLVTDDLAHRIGLQSATDFREAIVLDASDRQPPAVSLDEPLRIHPRMIVGRAPLPATMLVPAPYTTVISRKGGLASVASALLREQSATASGLAVRNLKLEASTAASEKCGSQPSNGAHPGLAVLADKAVDTRNTLHRRGRSQQPRGWASILLLLAAGGVVMLAYEQSHPGLLKAMLFAVSNAAPGVFPGESNKALLTPDRSRSATTVADQHASSAASTHDAVVPTPIPSDRLASQDQAVGAALAFKVNGSGRPHVVAVVSTREQRARLIELLDGKIGASNVEADITVHPGVRVDWLEHVDALRGLMAVPNAELELHSTCIGLAGMSVDQAKEWSDRLQKVFGPSWRVVVFDAGTHVDEATQSFRHAIVAAIDGGHPCMAKDIARVLNTQIIDFAHSSSHVSESAKDNLDESAALLRACATAGHPVKVEIAVYTNAMGDETAAKRLSMKRADAIRSVLIDSGVTAASLTAQGYGSARPIASNLTSIGRFLNRRAEFIVTE